ncbi:MAG TPA: RHS repeat-associated core domain-containing protein, partial [Chitinophagales bacterium]|nr:RHS repeat-associated core domain-containing protein [Chitinophagales bacterium]
TTNAFASHWNTPSNSKVDVLGRTVKTTSRLDNNITDNLVTMKYTYDIRGNQLTVTDALGRRVFTNYYSLANKILATLHIDGGYKFAIADVMGKAITASDTKGSPLLTTYDPTQGAQVYNSYDATHRPRAVWAIDKTSGSTSATIDNTESVTMRQLTFYGDDTGVTDPQSHNLLGKPYKHYDEAGLNQVDDYDFKGNPLQKIRYVISDTTLLHAFDNLGTTGIKCYRANWTGVGISDFPSVLDATVYQSNIEYDALNRSNKITYPADYTDTAGAHRKIVVPSYNRAGALESISMTDMDNTTPINYVKHIAYNAKGQKLLVAWYNGVMMRFAYDPQTFRLARVKAEKYTNPGTYEYDYSSGTTRYDQAYTYDLVGNILGVSDKTPDSGIAGNTEELQRLFEYDALYRLIYADGREDGSTASNLYWTDPPQNTGMTNATSCRIYHQNYTYDKLGNIISLQHVASGNSFTRNYNYNTGNNQTANIKDGSSTTLAYFTYDSNGNQVTANDNRNYEYDFGDKMRSFYVEASGSVTQYTQYLYDSTGSRVKKLVWSSATDYESVTYVDGALEYRVKAIGEKKNYLQIQGGIELRIGAYSDDDMVTNTYAINDYLSSAVIRLKDDGGVYDKEEFYPYGDSSLRTWGKKRYRYTGKEKDQESGLYYYAARYYCCWTGKFQTVDPLTAKFVHQSSYCYADCNPIVKNDPTGMGDPKASPPKSNGNNTQKKAAATGTKGDNKNAGSTNTNNYVIPPPTPFVNINGPAGSTPDIKTNNNIKAPLPASVQPMQEDKQVTRQVMGAAITHSQSEWKALDAAMKEQQENPDVLEADMYGNGVIGPKKTVEANIAAQRQAYNEQVGENIAGGFFGAVGYMAGGDQGSFYGAQLDAVSQGVVVPQIKPMEYPLRVESAPLNTFAQAPYMQEVENVRATYGQNSNFVSTTKNIAYSYGIVNGESYRSVAISGTTQFEGTSSAAPTTRVFSDMNGFHSEALMLEAFTNQYTTNGQTNPSVTGTITIVSERPICDACMQKIKECSKIFPNLTIRYVNGAY